MYGFTRKEGRKYLQITVSSGCAQVDYALSEISLIIIINDFMTLHALHAFAYINKKWL